MRFKRVVSLTAPLLLYGASTALAAGSGTPLDNVATQLVAVLSGPAALIMIARGFIGAGIIYMMSRDFWHAFVTLGALAVAWGLRFPIQCRVELLFPHASPPN